MPTTYSGSALKSQVVKPRFTEAEQLRRNCQALLKRTKRANDKREADAEDSDEICDDDYDRATAPWGSEVL